MLWVEPPALAELSLSSLATPHAELDFLFSLQQIACLEKHLRGAWWLSRVSVSLLTLDQAMIWEWGQSPASGSMLSRESAWDSLPCPPTSLSLSLSLSRSNK